MRRLKGGSEEPFPRGSSGAAQLPFARALPEGAQLPPADQLPALLDSLYGVSCVSVGADLL